jgi:hypothetical protein
MEGCLMVHCATAIFPPAKVVSYSWSLDFNLFSIGKKENVLCLKEGVFLSTNKF